MGKRERILEEIRKTWTVSFDVFDTLIIRQTLVPSDVFFLTEEKAKAHGVFCDGFVQCRMQAEKLRITLEEIYAYTAQKMGWNREISAWMMQTELDTESEVIKPRTSVVSLMREAVQMGKNVILTSDMYLTKPRMTQLLTQKGINGYEELFVSCDWGKDKHNGLFEEVIRRFGPKETILHIGDNPVADLECCTSNGIRGILIPSVRDLAMQNGWQEKIRNAQTFKERLEIGRVIADRYQDPFQENGKTEKNAEKNQYDTNRNGL